MRTFTVAFSTLLFFSLTACANSGAIMLNPVQLPDGSKLYPVQIKTKGHSGPDLTALEMYHCPKPDTPCHLNSKYSTGAPGLWESVLSGVAGQAVLGGGIAGAGALIRPSRTSVQTSVSGTSSAGAEAGANAASKAISESEAEINFPRRKH
jgi:hypothetical protein